MDKIKRIVFVCTGNTCRSPMALALAGREAENRMLNVELDSCGTGARPGNRATNEAVTACADAGLDISHHSSKNITDVNDTEDTLYVTMSRQHSSWLQFVIGIPGDRVTILGEGIPDPFGGDIETYKYTLGRLSEAVHLLFDRISDNIPQLESGSEEKQDKDTFEFEIYKAEGEHAPAISMLERKTFTDAWSQSLLADEIENEDAIFLIASDKHEAVSESEKKAQKVYGYAIAIIAADEAQLLKLSVDEHVRRLGIAETLLKRVADEAVLRGCSMMTLEARVSNAPAIALYEKEGFESNGVRPGFYSEPKEDALIMSKTLR